MPMLFSICGICKRNEIPPAPPLPPSSARQQATPVQSCTDLYYVQTKLKPITGPTDSNGSKTCT